MICPVNAMPSVRSESTQPDIQVNWRGYLNAPNKIPWVHEDGHDADHEVGTPKCSAEIPADGLLMIQILQTGEDLVGEGTSTKPTMPVTISGTEARDVPLPNT